MGATRQKLKFESIGDLDSGALRIEFNKQLQALVQDCHDRPYLEKPRVLTLKVALKPVANKQGGPNAMSESIVTAWTCEPKAPTRGSSMTVCSVMNDGSLVFMSDMPDAGDDNTIFDEAERVKLEREERARVSANASDDQAAVERQAVDGR